MMIKTNVRRDEFPPRRELVPANIGYSEDKLPDKISAKVSGNHGAILKKDFHAVADAVREVVPLTKF
jgi:hypothetical protein